MSGPQGFEPTRPWSPDPSGAPDQQGEAQPTQTPWWQNVRRHRSTARDYPAQPQEQPAQVPPQQHLQQPPARPGVYAAPPASTVDPPKQSNRWPLIIASLAGVLLALVVVVVAVLILAGTSNRKQLDVAKAEAGVRQILTDPTHGYGVENLTEVKCNQGDNPTVKKGETFSCDVNVNGAKRRVAVLFIDDNGTYEVDRPR